jgi:hypothetical protein
LKVTAILLLFASLLIALISPVCQGIANDFSGHAPFRLLSRLSPLRHVFNRIFTRSCPGTGNSGKIRVCIKPVVYFTAKALYMDLVSHIRRRFQRIEILVLKALKRTGDFPVLLLLPQKQLPVLVILYQPLPFPPASAKKPGHRHPGLKGRSSW